MSYSEISRRYHNLKYAVLTLCNCIESCDVKKVVDEVHLPRLDVLVEELNEVKKQLAIEMSDVNKQKDRWVKQIKKMSADAACDETISEELKERIVGQLTELAEGVKTHEDS